MVKTVYYPIQSDVLSGEQLLDKQRAANAELAALFAKGYYVAFQKTVEKPGRKTQVMMLNMRYQREMKFN